jgi:hypothetical protein
MIRKHLARRFELKAAADDGTFSGYGSVFLNEDSYGDVVEPGAFKATLGLWKSKGRLPPILWQHSAKDPIGVYTSMAEDEKGLLRRGPAARQGRPARRACVRAPQGRLGHGPVDRVQHPEGRRRVGSRSPRPTGFAGRSVGGLARHVPGERRGTGRIGQGRARAPKEFERFLRDAGLSRSQAKALMSGGYKALDLRDADDEDAEVQAVKSALRSSRRSSGR